MASELNFFPNLIESKILNIHTGYLAKVKSVNGSNARVQPLTVYKAVGGKEKEQSLVSAVIPQNIKYRAETITYLTSDTTTATKTVLVPENLAVGDIVYVGVCDRDITNAKNGKIGNATSRHHNINDSVIIRVVR